MAASGREEEQRRALREALRAQLADLDALSGAAEAARREQAELQARLEALEGKVLHGGVNLLEKVDALEARGAAARREVEAARRQEDAQRRRLEALAARARDAGAAQGGLEGEVAARSRQLRALYAEYKEKKAEAAVRLCF